jgi:hypothetical protein
VTLMTMTSDSLSQQIGKDVPEVYVIIAKHNVLGMDDEGIKEVIGCTMAELQEVLDDPIYREVRLILGAVHAQGIVDQTTGWDSLEERALKNLSRRIDLPNQDQDFVLRVAAIANKASRRAKAGLPDGVLDGTQAKTAKISLTTRLVRSFARDGAETQTIEKKLSIEDGTMVNPSFDEVDDMLSVSNTPSLPIQIEAKAAPNVSFDDLDDEMNRRLDGR